MSRQRRAGQAAKMSLFPFLSVLVGVLGALTLEVAGMSLISLRGSKQAIDYPLAGETEKMPVYVECRKEGLMIHPEGIEIATDDMDEEEGAWGRLLASVGKASNKRYVLFLVRPDGLESFSNASAMASGKQIAIGYEPVHAAGPIVFRKAIKGGMP